MNRFVVRRAFSMLEMLAVVAILGVVAVIVVPRFGGTSQAAKKCACQVNCKNIETQVRLWNRGKGVWPASDLSDIRADVLYFPQGLPTCPVDQSAYQIDSTTRLVVGHSH